MQRTVSAEVAFTTIAGQSRVVLQLAVARLPGLAVDETFTATLDDEPLTLIEIPTGHGGILHAIEFDRSTGWGGKVQLRYDATVASATVTSERAVSNSAPDETDDRDIYLRPSRYAESDRLMPTARSRFGDLQGLELLSAVGDFVHGRLNYVPGSSRVTDGAVETLLGGAGVCRDYAHLVVALLRGMDVPARMVAVYAPGLSPMDFHAVAEAWVDGTWYVIDATRLAPRRAMVRIATGRDAADTAFLSSYGAGIQMGPQEVTATMKGDLIAEDPAEQVQLA